MRNIYRLIQKLVAPLIVALILPNFAAGQQIVNIENQDPSDNLACTHAVIMYDIMGDGWNGGYLTVYLDSVIVLNGLTMLDGSGPDTVFFDANDDQEITAFFMCSAWCFECWYEIADAYGNIIYIDGVNGDPTGIPAGTCYTNCLPTRLGENDISASVKIYPNPARSVIFLESAIKMKNLNLLDLSGRIIQTYQPAEEYEYTMDVSSNEAGVYLLRVDTEQGQHTRKIIID